MFPSFPLARESGGARRAPFRLWTQLKRFFTTTPLESSSPPTTLNGLSDIRRHFIRNDRPVFFVSATCFNLIGMDDDKIPPSPSQVVNKMCFGKVFDGIIIHEGLRS